MNLVNLYSKVVCYPLDLFDDTDVSLDLGDAEEAVRRKNARSDPVAYS